MPFDVFINITIHFKGLYLKLLGRILTTIGIIHEISDFMLFLSNEFVHFLHSNTKVLESKQLETIQAEQDKLMKQSYPKSFKDCFSCAKQMIGYTYLTPEMERVCFFVLASNNAT